MFGGDKPLTRVPRNARLQQWFAHLAEVLRMLTFDGAHVESAGRQLQHMSARLIEVRVNALQQKSDFLFS